MKIYFLLTTLIALCVSCNSGVPDQPIKISNPIDSLIEKRNEPNSDASLFSEITCPKCGHVRTEKLPTEVCQVSYTCENCKEVMHPKDGDCCVFCTYGTHKCPSKQDS